MQTIHIKKWKKKTKKRKVKKERKKDPNGREKGYSKKTTETRDEKLGLPPPSI